MNWLDNKVTVGFLLFTICFQWLLKFIWSAPTNFDNQPLIKGIILTIITIVILVIWLLSGIFGLAEDKQ